MTSASPPFDASGWSPDQIDTALPQASRIYDYWTGGKDAYTVDRDLAERVGAVAWQVPETARANLAFVGRAVRYAVGRAGVGQLLDVGCGLAAPGDAACSARALDPGVRVVVVDRDPVAVTRARALLGGDPARTGVVCGDLCDPCAILDDPRVRRVLDLARPVVLVLGAVLHFVADDEGPAGMVRTLCGALAPGSVLVFSHATADFDVVAGFARGRRAVAAAAVYNALVRPRLILRTGPQVAALMGGWPLIDPGLVAVDEWRPESIEHPRGGRAWAYGAVAVKPAPGAPVPVGAVAQAGGGGGWSVGRREAACEATSRPGGGGSVVFALPIRDLEGA